MCFQWIYLKIDQMIYLCMLIVLVFENTQLFPFSKSSFFSTTVRPYVHIYNIRNHVDIWSTSTQARARFIRFV